MPGICLIISDCVNMPSKACVAHKHKPERNDYDCKPDHIIDAQKRAGGDGKKIFCHICLADPFSFTEQIDDAS